MKKKTMKKPALKPSHPGDTPSVMGLPPESALEDDYYEFSSQKPAREEPMEFSKPEYPPHARPAAVDALPYENRPKLTAVELANITGALHLPATKEGAIMALQYVWDCALVLAEQSNGLQNHDASKARIDEIKKTKRNVIGFDPFDQKNTYPMKHKRFIALLNRSLPPRRHHNQRCKNQGRSGLSFIRNGKP